MLRKSFFVHIGVVSGGGLFLFLLVRSNYLLFHSIVELLAILTGFSMFLFALTTLEFNRNFFLQRLGFLYGGVVVIDLLHTLAYKGMGIFPGYSANLPTQFWIWGRFLEFGGLTAAVLLPPIKGNHRIFIWGVFPLTLGGVIAIFAGFFPACFIEGQGLTPFKVIAEYALCLLFAFLAFRVWKTQDGNILPLRKALLAALFLSIAAELSFTLYTDVYGFFNMLGHLFRFFSYFVLLENVLVEAIQKPFRVLLFEVQREKEEQEERARRDALTGLFNRHFFNQWIQEYAQQSSSLGIPSTLVLLDLDGFKEINDSWGHLVGDAVLTFVAQTLQRDTRQDTFVCRYGGDEFVLVFLRAAIAEATVAVKRIEKTLMLQREFSFPIAFSYGMAEFHSAPEIGKALAEADRSMYAMKREKKSSQALSESL